jgi:DNA-binding GntR family transcriptional regulator
MAERAESLARIVPPPEQDGGRAWTAAVGARGTQKDRVYLALREALMYGRYPPGETVTVRSLSETFGAGTMPVRDAVQRLVAERALQFLPNGRLRVPALDARELRDLIDLRLVLECYAARRAAAHAGPDTTAALRDLTERLERDSGAGLSSQEILASNFRFHFALYSAGRSDQLTQMIEGLWLRVGPLLITLISAPDSRRYLEDEHVLHRRVVDAIELRDPEYAGSAMRAIIERTGRALGILGGDQVTGLSGV